MDNNYNSSRGGQTPTGGSSGAPRKKKKRISVGGIIGRIVLVLFTLCVIGVLTIAIFFKIFMTYVNTTLLPSLETETQELTMALPLQCIIRIMPPGSGRCWRLCTPPAATGSW